MRKRYLEARGLRTFLADESGGTAIEYALIASLISIAIIGSVNMVGQSINDNFYDRLIAAFD